VSRKRSNSRKADFPVLLSILLVLVGLALTSVALAGDLRAYFDRKSVFEGDTVTLVIETTGDSLGQPDLSALNPDFDVLGTSQSTNISIINGQRTDTIRLLVSLAPRHRGRIQVPPIPVGNERTEPLMLQVSKLPDDASGGAGDDIFVELEVGADSDKLMVQQQAPMTVRLFSAVPLLRGDLEDPRVDGALVTKLAKDREYSTQRNGREYRVIERSYSLSPERSGELRIPPVRFEGNIRSKAGRGTGSARSLFGDPFFDRLFQDGSLSQDPFGIFNRGKPVSARSRGVTLEVEPRPDAYAGDHWLPAQTLKIVDSWAESPPELRVGEPVTRTLTIQAQGLSGSQIPQIEIPEVPGLRLYPEEPESETRSDGETLYGISRQDETLIPTKAGELVIPEIQVTWWDTVAQKERATKVPSWNMKVTGTSSAGTTPELEPQPEGPDLTEAPREAAGQIKNELAADNPNLDRPLAGNGRRLLTAAAVASALLLLGAGGWALRRYRRPDPPPTPAGQTRVEDRGTVRIQVSEARKTLRTACAANDARGAAKALLNWAEAVWQGEPPRNLGALAARLARGGDEVRELERHLYAPAATGWDGMTLCQALQGGLVGSDETKLKKVEVLDPLYPSQRARS
jgi:hypothetical protein